MKRTLLLIFPLVILFAGCALTDRLALTTVSNKEKEIAALKAQFVTEMAAHDKQISDAKDVVIKSKDGVIDTKNVQMQAAANSFYGQSLVYKTIIEPLRTDLILTNLTDEGWAALAHMMPSYDQMIAMNERIAKELDITKTSLADLKKSHDEVMQQNAKLVEDERAAQIAADAAKIKLDETVAAKKEAETKGQHDLLVKQDELVAAQNSAIATEKARADDRAAIQAMKLKITFILGGLALAALAGAIWSPVFKDKLGILAAILGFLSVAIWYVTPLIVGIVGGAALIVLVGWALYHIHITDKTNSALINANNDIQQTNKPVYDSIVAPAVAAYTTKYVKNADGTISTVPDPTITAAIDTKLMATDRK